MSATIPNILASAPLQRTQYPTYRDSGVEWLGATPEHWSVQRLRFLCRVNPPKSEVSSLPKDTEVSFLPMERIGEDGSLSLEETRTIAQVEQGYTYCREGDVIVAKITPCFENGKGAICHGLVNGVGFGTTELHVIRTGPNMNPAFVSYLTRSRPFRQLGIASMKGAAGQQRVSDAFVKDFMTPLPPLPEQHDIAAFLDRETAKIDALVASKERLIELLQEKRMALISQAVTKGLDPTVPMKDSGVEWLGKIPIQWTLTPFRRICQLQQGLQIAQSERFADPSPSRYEYITIRSIHAGEEEDSREYVETPSKRVLCEPNDILMARTGATGEVITGQRGAFHNNFFKVDYDRMQVDQRFLVYYLQNSLIRQHLLLMAGTTTIPDLNHGAFLSSPFVAPPRSEQLSIANYLDRETAKIDALIAKVREHIDKLREYRTALISAAVTGQIDVRGEVP